MEACCQGVATFWANIFFTDSFSILHRLASEISRHSTSIVGMPFVLYYFFRYILVAPVVYGIHYIVVTLERCYSVDFVSSNPTVVVSFFFANNNKKNSAAESAYEAWLDAIRRGESTREERAEIFSR